MPSSRLSPRKAAIAGIRPLIIVGGMNGRPLILDEGTANEKQIWPPVIDYAQVALAAGKGLAAYGLTKDWNRLGDAIMPLAVELMAPSACDADGNSMYNITTATYPESVAHYPELHIGEKSEEGLVASAYEKYGGSHVYFFNYDWRLDPMDHAKDLNAMIQKAKAETGHSKVDIAACSMGGAITMAYLATYGYSDIDTCLFITSAFSGSLIGTELLKKNVHIDKDALKHYLNLNVNSETGLDALLDIVVEILDLTGALDTLLNGANSMIEALLDRVYTEILAETMCRMPGVWLLIRDDAYEQAKAAFLDEDENAVLIERIDDYHYNVMQKRKQIIDDAMAAGVKVVFTSHYGDAVLPSRLRLSTTPTVCWKRNARARAPSSPTSARPCPKGIRSKTNAAAKTICHPTGSSTPPRLCSPTRSGSFIRCLMSAACMARNTMSFCSGCLTAKNSRRFGPTPLTRSS